MSSEAADILDIQQIHRSHLPNTLTYRKSRVSEESVRGHEADEGS